MNNSKKLRWCCSADYDGHVFGCANFPKWADAELDRLRKVVSAGASNLPDMDTDTFPAVVSRVKELEYQVKQLEEYMLKGVAFRDELQLRITVLEQAIKKIYTTQMYEDQKKEAGVSVEIVGAILDAAEKAGCRI